MPIKSTFEWLGYLGTFLALCTAIYAFLLWLWGIAPVLYRLGTGLSSRKIAIFAKGDELRSLEALISDARIFDGNTRVGVTSEHSIGMCEDASLFVVHWTDWADQIETILAQKKDRTAMVVYAEPGSIPQEVMKRIANERNTTVCNFRGRLLNDLLTSMMTTS